MKLIKEENGMTLDEFIQHAEIILVDDAESFEINQWEEDYEKDICEELGEEYIGNDKKDNRFFKYKLDNESLRKVIDKISTNRFDILDGVTTWKTRRFLRANHLTVEDLQDVLRNLKFEDYKTNSVPIDEDDGYNEAIIFCKKSKVKDVGPFKLYIKLDYDTIEQTPTIIISMHTAKGNRNIVNESKDIKDFTLKTMAEHKWLFDMLKDN